MGEGENGSGIPGIYFQEGGKKKHKNNTVPISIIYRSEQSVSHLWPWVVCVRSQEHNIFRGKSKSGCTRKINECDGTWLTDYIVQNPEIGWRILTHKGGREEEEAWVR